MTDEEFAKLFPNVKWPQTFEGKGGTYMSRGSLVGRPSTLRDRFMVDFLGGIYGNDTEARDRINNLMVYADFFGGPLFGAHDAPLAIDEGRYKDAAISGITAVGPFLGKPAKLLGNAIGRRLAVDEMIDNLPNPKLPEPARNLGPTIADDDIGLTAGGRSNPMSQSLPENTSAIIRNDNSPGVDDVKQYPLFDPPNKPQRPFAADYTKGVKDDEVDEAGNLLVDMDGDPFIAKYKVGRLTKGGDDVGLTLEQYKALAEDIIEKKIEIVPRTDIKGSSGQLKYDPIGNKPTRLRLANDTKVKK